MKGAGWIWYSVSIKSLYHYLLVLKYLLIHLKNSIILKNRFCLMFGLFFLLAAIVIFLLFDIKKYILFNVLIILLSFNILLFILQI